MEIQELIEKVKKAYSHSIEKVCEDRLPLAWTEDQERAFGTVRPTLLIGLGGSGTKSVARLKRKIEKFYKGDRFEEHRKVIRFRVIDTLAYERLLREDPVTCEVISRDEYFYIGGFNPGEYVNSQLALDRTLRNWWDESWLPPADTIIDQGAKRVRQLGRLAFNNIHIRPEAERRIEEDINNAIRLYEDLVNRGETRMPGEEIARAIYVYIFSGSCGGTGSGVLFDTIYIALKKIRELEYNPIIRLIIFMPRIFIQLARKMKGGDWLARAYEANAYAFFKELQHLITNSRDFFSKIGGRGIDERIFPEKWKPNRIYLIDTEIAGREIGEPEDLYTLAADYIFHYITTPMGQQLESSATNIDARLNTFARGRPQAFSSPGISYIVYPSKTFGRCLTAYLLKEALDVILKSSLSSEEKKSAEKRAEDFVTQNQDWLSADNIDSKLLERTSTFLSAIPDASQTLRESGGKPSGKMKKAEEIGEEQKKLGKQDIEAIFTEFKEKGIKTIGERLCGEICKLGETSVESTKQFLADLKEQIDREKKRIEIPSSQKVEDQAKFAIDQVERLEGKWLVWDKKAKIEQMVRSHAEKIREEAHLEFRLYAANKRNQYLEEIKKLIDEIRNHLSRVESTLRKIKDVMDTEKYSFNVHFDESSVTITTQFIPGRPDKNMIESLYQEAKIDIVKKAREIFSSDEIKPLFWQLGLSEEKELESAINTFIKNLSELGIDPFGSILKKKITEVVVENFENEEKFKEGYGHNFYFLADPCWAYRLDEILSEENALTSTNPSLASPLDFPVEDYLPADLRCQPLPGDPRMLILLRSDHALPLFAVRGIRIYRGGYLKWLSTFRDQNESPPHIVKIWNEPGVLEDLLPSEAPPPTSKEAFAFGLFLDWLVREKKHEKVLSILRAKEGWEHTGPIYERRRYYHFIRYEPEEGYLRRRGKEGIVLGQGRNAAALKVDEDIEKSVAEFRDISQGNIPDREFITLINEYIDYLTESHHLSEIMALSPERQEEVLRELREDERLFKRQLLDEIEILKRYKKELEGER